MVRLSLSLLGPLQIALDGQPAVGFAYNKGRALLAYLAVEADCAHQRDTLVGLLWPELPDPAARTNLRQVLANLREAIGDATAASPFLLITRDTIQFNPSSDYELDMISFTTLLDACATHSHRHLARCRSCAARMQQALTLYRGDFLAEFALGDSASFDEWALRHREQLHQRALDALTHLADYHERCGDEEPARRYSQRQIELDPWREEAHRQLMRLLARGQRSAALAQYEACRRVLAHDLNVEPAAETTALYEQIRDGEPRTKNQEPRTGSTRHTALPLPPTPLIGRATELAELGELLENPGRRLITIAGPGGIGKTRLALAAATEQAQAFADGAAFVPLAAISAAEFVAPAIMAALDLTLQGQRDPRDQLLDYLRSKELLIVLDNFEQLLGPGVSQNNSAADLLTDILQHAPGITLVITSRERLALQGEWLFDLPGLSYPIGDLVDDVESYSAAQLFLQRAGQVRRHFALAEGEAGAVAQICRLVEGLPLAIELAAAALRGRSCAAIADALETNFSALTTVLRSIPERHRSIWATFEYSWGLLSDEERLVFPRLAVFRGGFTLEAAEAVYAQGKRQKVEGKKDDNTAPVLPFTFSLLPLLTALVDKSLLRWDGAARYDMHELVRQYASEKLDMVGEADAISRTHALYYLAMAEQAELELWGPQQVKWLQQLDIEHDNVRAALEWSHRGKKTLDLGARLVVALGWFWLWRGHRQEGYTCLRRVLDSGTEPTLLRARALYALGMLLLESDIKPARAPFEESLAISQALGDVKSEADALYGLGRLTDLLGGEGQIAPDAYFEVSLALYQQIGHTLGIAQVLGLAGNRERCKASLALYRSAGHLRGCADVLTNLARMAKEQDDLERAMLLLQEALDLYHQLQDEGGELWVLLGMCDIHQANDDYEHAEALAEEGMALARKLNDRIALAWTLNRLGVALSYRNEFLRASSLFDKSVIIFQELGRWDGLWQGIIGRARIAVATGKAIQAVQLCAVVDTASLAQRDAPSEWPPEHRNHYRRVLATARAQLDDATFAAAWAAGRALPLEQAVAEALGNPASA